MARRDIAVLVGSLREASLNRRMAHVLPELAPDTLQLDEVGFGDLPLYDEDLERSPPPAWTAFRERIARADGFLFVTPEYNRSIPGGLKNALDVGSRPYGKSGWARRPGAVMSVSPGALGGFGANHHLRQCMVFLDVWMMAQPEAYVGGAGSLFDEAGRIGDEGTAGFLRSFLKAFGSWVELHAKTAGGIDR